MQDMPCIHAGYPSASSSGVAIPLKLSVNFGCWWNCLKVNYNGFHGTCVALPAVKRKPSLRVVFVSETSCASLKGRLHTLQPLCECNLFSRITMLPFQVPVNSSRVCASAECAYLFRM